MINYINKRFKNELNSCSSHPKFMHFLISIVFDTFVSVNSYISCLDIHSLAVKHHTKAPPKPCSHAECAQHVFSLHLQSIQRHLNATKMTENIQNMLFTLKKAYCFRTLRSMAIYRKCFTFCCQARRVP